MHYMRQINSAKSHLPDRLEGRRLGWISANLSRWRISSKEHAEMRAHLLQSHSSRTGLSCQHSPALSLSLSLCSLQLFFSELNIQQCITRKDADRLNSQGAEQVRVNTLIAKEKPWQCFSKCVFALLNGVCSSCGSVPRAEGRRCSNFWINHPEWS